LQLPPLNIHMIREKIIIYDRNGADC
jgi:hypothetical protein